MGLLTDLLGDGNATSGAIKSVRRTTNAAGGDDYAKSTVAWEPVDSANLSLSFTSAEIAVGDWVGVSVSFSWNTAAVSKYADCASYVAGSPARRWSSDGATPAGEGVLAWMGASGTLAQSGGVVWRQIAAADLDGGALTIKLMWGLSTATAALIYCRTDDPLIFQAQVVRG